MDVPFVTLSGKALTGYMPELIPQHLLANLPTSVRLGRRRPMRLPHVVNFNKHFNPALATNPPPESVDYYTKAASCIARMYLNDSLGDCVIAGKGHAFGIWSANDKDSGGIIFGTDQEIYQQYQSWCGPGDNGCIITDVLDKIKQSGMVLGGKTYKIDGYVAADWTNKLEVQVIQFLFGATTIGINLPQDWTNNDVWDVTDSQIVGGHDVTPCGYNDKGVFIASWGRIYLITWAAFNSTRWLEEYYAPVSSTWYNADLMAPSGVSSVTLLDDLKLIGQGIIPDIGPVPSNQVPPFFLFEGTMAAPVPVGAAAGYFDLTSAETAAHAFADYDNVSVMVHDSKGTMVETIVPSPVTPPVTYPNYVGTVTGSIPTGWFGHLTPVTFQANLSPSTAHHMGSVGFDWNTVWLLVQQYGPQILAFLLQLLQTHGTKVLNLLLEKLRQKQLQGKTSFTWQELLQLIEEIIALLNPPTKW